MGNICSWLKKPERTFVKPLSEGSLTTALFSVYRYYTYVQYYVYSDASEHLEHSKNNPHYIHTTVHTIYCSPQPPRSVLVPLMNLCYVYTTVFRYRAYTLSVNAYCVVQHWPATYRWYVSESQAVIDRIMAGKLIIIHNDCNDLKICSCRRMY